MPTGAQYAIVKTVAQKFETDEKVMSKFSNNAQIPKKSESNLNPATQPLKEGNGGSSSGGNAVVNSNQEESKGILITETEDSKNIT